MLIIPFESTSRTELMSVLILTSVDFQVQLDNQYDSKTHFPVVISIAPHNKTAVKLSLVEKRAHPGVERYFNHVSIPIPLALFII